MAHILAALMPEFQSTPSARRATCNLLVVPKVSSISIHALREESDKFEGDDHGIDAKISIHALREEGDREPSNLRYTDTYFNPRPPRGGRPPSASVTV